MLAITEISWLPFKPGTEERDAAAALKGLGPKLASQPGLQGHWCGARLERPNSLEFVNGRYLPRKAPEATTNPLLYTV